MAVLSRRFLGPLALLAAVGALAACDAAGPDLGPDPDPTPEPTQAETNPVARGAGFPEGRGRAFGVSLRAVLSATGEFGDGPAYDSESTFRTYDTSLWLTGVQDGRERFSAGSNALQAGYGPCTIDTTAYHQPFTLASGVDYDLGAWPVEQGAPVTAAGGPRVYGDLMAWDSYCTGVSWNDIAPAPDPERTLQGVRVNTAVFQHERADLAGVRFFRYEITNQSGAPITDLRAGFYADADVNSGAGFYSFNLLGGTDRYATVYVSPNAPATAAFGAVAAIGLLETPHAAPLTARRIEYRNAGPRPDNATPLVPYTEAGLSQIPEAPFRAMRGLDDHGDPIVDPTTGAATPFMYPGDPVAGTGWLDGTLPGGENGWDLRLLQSAAPVTLAPGETVVLTAVMISTAQADLAAGLSAVDALFSGIAADPSLWRFPVSAR